MDNSQAQQTFGEFLGHHCGAVVGQKRTRQTAFLDRLGEAVHQVLRGLGEVPLDVTAQSRVVIEDSQRDWGQPPAVVSEHLERSVMEIEMPQRPDVGGFVAADFSGLPPLFRAGLTWALLREKPRLFRKAMSLHVAFDRGIRGELPQVRFGLQQGREVVVMELVAPVGVVVVLENQALGERRGQGDLATVFAHGTAQGADRIIVSAPGCVVPSRNGGGRELDVASACGMGPSLGGEGADCCLERSAQGERLKSEPTTENRNRATGRPSN